MAGLLQKKADCARRPRLRQRARLPVRRAHACFVLELAGTSRTGSGRAAAPPGSGAAPAPLPLPPQARGPGGRGEPLWPIGRNPGQRNQASQDPARPLDALGREEGRRPGQITVNMQKRGLWAGRGLGAVDGKGHSHPRRATRGAPVCTCPGPLPLAQPVCGERAPAHRAPAFASLFPPTRCPF